MKKYFIYAISLPLSLYLAACHGGKVNPMAVELPASVKQEKIAPGLMREVRETESTSTASRTVEVLIRTKSEISAAQRDILEKSGAKIGSVTGDVLTATLPASAIAEIASLKFVVYIEPSVNLRWR